MVDNARWFFGQPLEELFEPLGQVAQRKYILGRPAVLLHRQLDEPEMPPPGSWGLTQARSGGARAAEVRGMAQESTEMGEYEGGFHKDGLEAEESLYPPCFPNCARRPAHPLGPSGSDLNRRCLVP